MARRQLEAALRSQRGFQEGPNDPATFTEVKVLKEVAFEEFYGSIYCLQYDFLGNTLAVGFANSGIQLLNALTGSQIRLLRHSRHGGFPIMCLRYHPNNPNIIYAGSSEGIIYSYDVNDGIESKVATENDNEINCLDFNLSGFELATGGRDLAIRIYDVKTSQVKNTYWGYSNSPLPIRSTSSTDLERNSMRVFALMYHPEYENIFVTGGWDNSIKIWDQRTNVGVMRTIPGPHICGDSLDLKDFKILTGSWVAKNAIQVWNYTDGILEKNLDFPCTDGAFLYTAQFCDKNVVLAGGSGTNSVQAINSETNKCLGSVQMNHPVQAMDSIRGGRLFAVGGADCRLKLCALV